MLYFFTMVLYVLGILLPGFFLDRLSNPLGGSDMAWTFVALLAVVALVI